MGLKPFKDNCFHFYRSDLENFADKLRQIPDTERAQIPELSKDRADILPFGMLVLTECMKFFDQEKGISTVRGLRHGLALTLLDPA
jgi:exopolyphosphatase/pppGpp-phosphohydrolase